MIDDLRHAASLPYPAKKKIKERTSKLPKTNLYFSEHGVGIVYMHAYMVKSSQRLKKKKSSS
jgi:phage terminase large subunit